MDHWTSVQVWKRHTQDTACQWHVAAAVRTGTYPCHSDHLCAAWQDEAGYKLFHASQYQQVRMHVAARLHAQKTLAVHHLERTFPPLDAGSAVRPSGGSLLGRVLTASALSCCMHWFDSTTHMCSCSQLAAACLQTAELSWLATCR